MNQDNGEKSDIVFFFTDDQRFDMLSGLGHSDVQTPNLDRLLTRGTAMTQAHIPGGMNAAICMPSRAMLHTSRTLFHLVDDGRSIPRRHRLLGEILKDAGYRCFGSGKWHNGTESFNRSFHDGRDIFFGGMNDHWNVPCFDYDDSGAYEGRIRVTHDWFYSNRTEDFLGDKTTPGKHSSELISDAGIDFLRRRPSDQPSFMYLSYLAPHDPRTMPEEFRLMYDPADIVLPESFMPEHPFDFGIREVRDEVLAPYPRTEMDTRRHIAEYYAMVTHLDHEIGRVIDEIERQGKLDSTLFIMAGDNGLAVGQHGLFGKQNAYEPSIRVPLIFSGPGIAENRRNDDFVYLLDILPTLCEYLGLSIPQEVDGRSFFSCLSSDSRVSSASAGRDEIFFAYSDLLRCLKDREYKLIEYRYGDSRHTQLFHHRQDPGECRDLAAQSDQRDRIIMMRKRLEKIARAWGDDSFASGTSSWHHFNEYSNGGNQ